MYALCLCIRLHDMANLDDRTVKSITIAAICLYAAVLIAGFATHHLLLCVSIINGVAGLLIIRYWIWDKLRPLKLLTEAREQVVLLIESIIVAFVVYAISSKSLANWLAILQYIIFAIHSMLLILFLIFMLTFKMKKMF